jgi:phospholipid transport system substrate-binding protein
LSSEPAYIQQVVSELVVPHFEFDVMAELVLDHYWSDMDIASQTCFISGFKDMLVERYAYILLSYDNHQIYYEPSRDIGEIGNRLVRQTITRNGMKPLPIEYAMQRHGVQWKVVDLIVDGVSLIRNYRGIFQSKIHTQGMEYFIQNFPGCGSSQ